MSVQVSDSVLKETTKCPHNLSCLEAGQCGDYPMCEVDYPDGKNVLFLVSKGWANCPYHVFFGNGQICTCQTHFELASKHEK